MKKTTLGITITLAILFSGCFNTYSLRVKKNEPLTDTFTYNDINIRNKTSYGTYSNVLYPYRIIGVYEYDKKKIDNVFNAVKKKYTSFNHMKEEQVLPSIDETARSCHTIVRGEGFGNVNTQRDYDYAFSRCMDTYGVKRTQYIGESLNVSDVNDTNTLNFLRLLWTKNTHNTHNKNVVQQINLIAYENGEDKVAVYLALHPEESMDYYIQELIDLNNFVLAELKKSQLKRIDLKEAEVLIETK